MSEQESKEQAGLPDSPVEPNTGSVDPDTGSVEPETQTPVLEEYDPTFRDIPAVFRVILSLLSGSPLVVSGVVLYINTHSPLVISGFVMYISTDLSAWVSAAISLTGVVITLGGLYFSLVGTRPDLNLLPEERTLALRHPSVKPAFARMIISLPFFAAAGYLLLEDRTYAVYYFALFLVAVYLYLWGVIRYWLVQHTTYYVTNRRAVRMYRLASLNTTKLPVSAINSISETRSFFEMITGRGSVMVASGVGSFHKVRMEDMGNPGPMAQVIRERIS